MRTHGFASGKSEVPAVTPRDVAIEILSHYFANALQHWDDKARADMEILVDALIAAAVEP